MRNIGGNSPSGRIFKEVFDRIHEGLEEIEFEHSDSVVRRTYCTGSGRLASSTCYSTAVGWYKEDNIPGYCTDCGSYGADSGDDEAEETNAAETTASAQQETTQSQQQTTNAEDDEPDPPATDPPATAPPTTVSPPTAAPPVDPGEDR